MVKSLHAAGIEVILDVVYNHTAEGNHLGPTLSFKGIDNPAYYRLVEDEPAVLHGLHRHRQLPQRAAPPLPAADHGLAALLGDRDARRRVPVRPRLGPGPRVLRRRPAGDVLRARAAGPGRQPGEADRRAVGRRARAATRSATSRRSGPSGTAPTATPSATSGAASRRWASSPRRLAGSSDLYEHSGRRPVASINFVTAHDGFTLRDLVSYNEKHNEANGEDNNDGESHNRSWNHGVEGPTDDPEILGPARPGAAQLPGHPAAQPGRADAAARRRARPHPGRQQQHLRPGLRDLAGSTGTGPTSRWSSSPPRWRGSGTSHPTFRRKRFFTGTTVRTGDGRAPQRHRLAPPRRPGDGGRRLGRAGRKTIGMYLNGHGIAGKDDRGGTITDDHFLLYFNAGDPLEVTLPPEEYADAWDVVIDTGGALDDTETCKAGTPIALESRSLVVLREHAGARGGARPLRGRVRSRPRRPTADPCALPANTYRLQITEDFDLFEAARRLPYLRDLGVDWVYLSPLLAAEPGSSHGYDVVAHDRIDPARGGEEGLAALSTEARRLGHGRAGRHRPQPRRGRDPGRERLVVGPPAARPGLRPRRRLRRRLGGRRRPDPDPGRRRRRPGRRRRTDRATSPWSTASCATTTTGSRSRPAREDDDPQVGPRPPALRAGQLAGRRPRAQLPPVLRRQHPRRDPGGGPRGLRRLARRDRALVRRGPRRRSAGRPPGRAARARAATSTTWPGSPAAPTSWSRRSCTPARTCPSSWATAGTTGYDALALIDRVLTDPAGRGAARPPRDPAPRGAGRLGADGPRHQAGGRRRHPRLGGPPHRPRAGARSAGRPRPTAGRRGRRAARLLPGLPLLPARGTRRTSTRPSTGPARTGPTWPARSTSSCRCSSTRTRPRPCASSRPAAW